MTTQKDALGLDIIHFEQTPISPAPGPIWFDDQGVVHFEAPAADNWFDFMQAGGTPESLLTVDAEGNPQLVEGVSGFDFMLAAGMPLDMWLATHAPQAAPQPDVGSLYYPPDAIGAEGAWIPPGDGFPGFPFGSFGGGEG